MKKINSFKTITYTFILFLIAAIVFFRIDYDWAKTVRYVCIGVLALLTLLIVMVFIRCNKENKIIDEYLDDDNYDDLVIYINKISKNHFLLFNERKYYYEYLLLLSSVGKNEEEKMVEGFNKFTQYDSFPMSRYHRACYEFSKNNFENIQTYYQHFINLPAVRKKTDMLFNVINVFYSMNLYVEGKIQEAQENLKKVDMSKIKMVCANNAIKIINGAIIVEKNGE